MAKQNITITKREEDSFGGIRYCEIKGTRWINRCSLPEHRKLQKGDVFNVYRREYETDAQGNITRWTCDRKYGCEFDGRSVETSLAALDQYIDENDFMRRAFTEGPCGQYEYLKPLAA